MPRRPDRLAPPLAVLLAASASLAHPSAQPIDQPADQSASQSANQPAEPPAALSGPSISPKLAELTLVNRSYDGRLVKLTIRPEVAAVERMPLSADSRARVEKVLADRAKVLDAIVIRNVPILSQINTAYQSGDTYETIRLWTEFSRELKPLRAMGKLDDLLAAALEPEEAETFRTLVNDYRDALVEDARAASDEPKKVRRFGVLMEENLRLMGEEIGRSFERQFDGLDQELEEMLAAVDATPAQRARIHALINDFANQTIVQGKTPTKFQETALFLGMLDALEPDQRIILLRLQRERDAG